MFSIFDSLIFIVFPIVFIALDAISLIAEYRGIEKEERQRGAVNR